MPSVSVILPVRNERQALPRLLDGLLEQDYPAERYEIVVVDGRSTDGTAELVRRRYRGRSVAVRVIDNPARHTAAGRNAGLQAAWGDAVVFLAGRCTVPSRHWLSCAAETLADNGAACLWPERELPVRAATRSGETIAAASASWLGRRLAPLMSIAGPGAVYRRTVFEQVGLYDEGFAAREEVDFRLRVLQEEVRVAANAGLAVQGEPQGSLRRLLWQMIRDGRSTARLMRKYPEQTSADQIAPLGIVLATLLSAYAWVHLPMGLAAVVTLPVWLFPGAALAASAQLGWRHGLRFAWKAPWVYLTMVVGQSAGMLAEYVYPEEPRPELDTIQRVMVEERNRAA